MYSDKVEVLRFESEPYRKKHLGQNQLKPRRKGMLRYNNNIIDYDDSQHKFIYHNGYHNTLV